MAIQVQSCAVMILVVLWYFYKNQKHLKLSTEIAYWRMYGSTFLSLILDIGSCVAITYMDKLPLFFVNLVCKSYLFSLVSIIGFLFMYIGAEIYASKKAYHKLLLKYFICAFAGMILIFVLPIKYNFNENTGALYSYGPSVMATYVLAAVTIVMLLVVTLLSWKKITKNRRESVVLTCVILSVAAITQFMNNQLLLVGFASALCNLVMYLKLENPGFNIDTNTGLFNQNAFSNYTKQYYDNQKSFSAIQLVFDSHAANGAYNEEDLLPTEVISFLSDYPHTLAFKGSGSVVALIPEDGQDGEQILKDLRNRFYSPWGKNKDVYFTPYWIYMPDSCVVSCKEELIDVLYRAQQDCVLFEKNHITIVDKKMADEVNEEKETVRLLEDALAEDRIEVFYQPIYSVKEKKFTAAEALVRIRDQEGNIITPGRFIPVAESNGMIMRLGEQVFKKVCLFLRNNDISRMGMEYIEVNLSVVQCGYEHLAADFIKIMKDYAIPPKEINFEITESASLGTKSTLLKNMDKLMEIGVNFSLDDFGTGQSNLNYIIDIPVKIVKFDREMTNAYFESSKARYVMDAAMDMIHGMGLNIVSEGVETAEQLTILEDLSISYVQGFYFSEPLPKDEFMKFIMEKNYINSENLIIPKP